MADITKKRKLNNVLNTIMGSTVGVFIGHTAFNYIDYQKHPNLYAMQSAPWYTSSLIYGAVTIGVIVISIILKTYFNSLIN